jgi:hypothetical protein
MIQLKRAGNKARFRDALTMAEGNSRARGGASRIAWIVLGIVAAAVTGAVVVWQVLDHSEDQKPEPEKDPGAEHM